MNSLFRCAQTAGRGCTRVYGTIQRTATHVCVLQVNRRVRTCQEQKDLYKVKRKQALLPFNYIAAIAYAKDFSKAIVHGWVKGIPGHESMLAGQKHSSTANHVRSHRMP